MKKIKSQLINDNFYKNIIYSSMYSIFPIMLLTITVIIVSIIVLGDINTDINNVDSSLGMIIGFSLPMVISLIICPLILEYYILKRTFGNIGISKIKSKKQGIVISLLIVLSVVVSILFLQNGEALGFTILLSFIIVAISEEFYVRGILYYELSNFWGEAVSILLTSFIFAFVYHANSDFLSNLFFRFPLALVLIFLRKKTGNIYVSILVHYIYNVSVNTF